MVIKSTRTPRRLPAQNPLQEAVKKAVKKVTSMVMPHEFTVLPTREDALLGVCNSPTKCMYARAIRRRFPNATYVAVNPNEVTITLGGRYYHFRIPRKCVLFMAKYDRLGKLISDSDLKKAKVTLTLTDVKACKYEGTIAVKERHRRNSAVRRADPTYVRPDGRDTLRAQLARNSSLVAAI